MFKIWRLPRLWSTDWFPSCVLHLLYHSAVSFFSHNETIQLKSICNLSIYLLSGHVISRITYNQQIVITPPLLGCYKTPFLHIGVLITPSCLFCNEQLTVHYPLIRCLIIRITCIAFLKHSWEMQGQRNFCQLCTKGGQTAHIESVTSHSADGSPWAELIELWLFIPSLPLARVLWETASPLRGMWGWRLPRSTVSIKSWQ